MTDKLKSTGNNVLLDEVQKSGMLAALLEPNTQLIKRGLRFNRRADELVSVLERSRNTDKIKGIASISLRTGSGFLINTPDLEFSDLNRDSFVEVIDYDPVRNNLVVIGNEAPTPKTSLHWFIYRGLPEVNSIIMLEDREILEKFQTGKFPKVTQTKGVVDIDLALEIIKSAKSSEISLIIGDNIQCVLTVGKTLEHVYNLIKTNLQDGGK